MQHVTALLINPGYEYIDVGLYANSKISEIRTVHKHQASKTLITTIDALLRDHNYSLDHLTFIGVNTGPGPFTTLRVAIATVNGLAYGSKIPLVAADGFDLWIDQTISTCTTPYLCIMLNAFSNDVYCAIVNVKTREVIKDCTSIENLCKHLKPLEQFNPNQPSVTLYGNGITVYQKQLEALDPKTIILNKNEPTNSSFIETMARIAMQSWANKDHKKTLLPHYMKATSSVINNKN